MDNTAATAVVEEVSTAVVVEVSTVVVAASMVAVDFMAAVGASVVGMVVITVADTAIAAATEECAEAQRADSVLAEAGVRDVLMARDRGARDLTRLRFATGSFIRSVAVVPLVD